MAFTYALGRAIFGGLFLYSGINHFKQAEAMEGYVAAKQVPYPHLAVQLSAAALTASGLSLVFGLKPRLGAIGAAAFLAAATTQMHDFWNQENPHQKQTEMIQFSKNVALFGAAMLIAAQPQDIDSI